MATKPSSTSTVIREWLLEYLASSEEVDTSILIDLVKRTRGIYGSLGKNAREMVSLRILESLLALRNKGAIQFSSVRNSKVRFDSSKHCEDVLRCILSEVSAAHRKTDGPDMFKWDVQRLIASKKASLPICALQKLKDAILKGNNPILASLKERSGLATEERNENRTLVDDPDTDAISQRPKECRTDGQMVDSQGNSITLNLENPKGILQENSPDGTFSLSKRDKRDYVENREGILQEDSFDRTLSHSKRDRSEDIQNRESFLPEDQTVADKLCCPHLKAVKRQKRDEACTSRTIGENLIPLPGSDLLEDSSGRIGQHGVREGYDLANGTTSKSTGKSIDHMHDDFCDKHPQNLFNDAKTTQDTSIDGEQQNISIFETKDNECSAEMRISKNAPTDVTHRNISVGEVRIDRPQLNASNNEAGDDMEHDYETGSSSDSESLRDAEVDIATKKRSFLSSQCKSSQDSMAMFDFTEMNLCVKCNMSGELLVCSVSACPIGVHESCLGSAASFDKSGKFLCPFCACSSAISECRESKKKAFLARKDLGTFIGAGDRHRPKKRSKKFHGSCQTNEVNTIVIEVDCHAGRTEIELRQVDPSVTRVHGNQPCGGNGAEMLIVGNTSRENIGREFQSARVSELQRIEVQADHDRDGGNLSSGHAEVEVKHDVLPQTTTSPHEAASPPNMDVLRQPATSSPHEAASPSNTDALSQPANTSPHKAASPPNTDVLRQRTTRLRDEAAGPTNNEAGESLKEENDKSPTLSFSLRVRKPKKQYTYPVIPQLRRKKVPWTEQEEKILEDGVNKFSSAHGVMPWTMILEFGSIVFQKGRTTVDLKDKWRNMTKRARARSN